MWVHFYNMVQQAGINNTRMQWVWCVFLNYFLIVLILTFLEGALIGRV